jgi:DNA-binding SARP family transcriptional activator/tetratricopeptide (TPR) repeat protein
MTMTIGGRPVGLGRRRELLLLAVLLLDAPKPVEIGRLIELMWDDDSMPRDPRAALYIHVSRLRRALAAVNAAAYGVSVDNAGSAYVAQVDPMSVDAHEFASLIREARVCRSVAARSEMLSTALGMWRGEPLAGLASADLRDRICPDLYELRLAAIEARTAADLELGRHEAIIPELTRLAAAHPSRERLAAALMLALHRAGRQRDALSVYAELARHLADELGLDPGDLLRSLRTAILRDDPDLRTGPPPFAAPESTPPPAQLPEPSAAFVGRQAELAEIRAAADSRVVTLSGMAGVGKSALAVHAAHALRDGYPDGQLYLDLRGFTAGTSPLDPRSALDRMLRALGVAPDAIPDSLDERSAAFRLRLSGRRVLVVLDNAATERQVEPLLADVAGCLTLVTSRLRLAGLCDAVPVTVDVLPPTYARALIEELVDAAATADPDTIAEIAELCGGLPLALRLAAARLRHRRPWTLAYLAERLRAASGRLLELEAGERSVTATLDLSYNALAEPERLVLRQMARTSTPDVDTPAVAALVGMPAHQTANALERLVDAHLLEQPRAGRYRFHSLVRLYAATVAAGATADDEDAAALDRLLHHYICGIAAAMAALAPYALRTRLRDAATGSTFPPFPSGATALAWLDTERDNLVGAAISAADAGRPNHARTVAEGLFTYLEAGSHGADAVRLFARVRDACRDHGDDPGQAYALRALGVFDARQGHNDSAQRHLRAALSIHRRGTPTATMAGVLVTLGENLLTVGAVDAAEEHFRQAVDLFRMFSEPMGEAHCLRSLSTALWTRGRRGEAMDAARRATRLCRDSGHRLHEAHGLMMSGMFARMDGDIATAMGDLTEALSVFETLGDAAARSFTLTQIGAAHAAAGDVARGCADIRHALTLAHRSGDVNAEFEALYELGEALRTSGDHDGAIHHQQAALELAERSGHPRDHVRACDGIARSLHATGHIDEAAAHWRRALDRYGSVPLPEVVEVRARLAAN